MSKIGYESSQDERQGRQQFLHLFKENPIPDTELLSNLGLYTRRQVVARALYMNDLYQKILQVPGVIMEFGCRWGQNLAWFISLRGIYEPFNQGRKIVGFDTFEGFTGIDEKDGAADIVTKGAYGVTSGYEDHLAKVLEYHESEAPMSHKKKFEIVKGDASEEVEKYLYKNPETVIALAYFDFDLYRPTKKCLEVIQGHLTKGSILAFDELHLREFPGETLALKEALGLDKYRLKRSHFSGAYQAYLVVE